MTKQKFHRKRQTILRGRFKSYFNHIWSKCFMTDTNITHSYKISRYWKLLFLLIDTNDLNFGLPPSRFYSESHKNA